MTKIRKRERKNWFYSYNMIFDQPISEHAKITYLYLCRCADSEGQSFPSYSTIGEKCSFSRSTAIRSIKDLEKIGLLSKEERSVLKDGKSINTSNLYIIYDSPEEEIQDENKVVSEGHHPSVSVEPPLVSVGHHPSVSVEPKGLPNEGLPNIKDYPINQSKRKEKNIDQIDTKKEKSPFSQDKEKATKDITEYNAYKSIISENIEYETLKKYHFKNDSTLDEILEVIVEVVTSKKETIRVNGEDKPKDIVKSTFLKLDSSHIEYVINSMKNTTTRANNIKSYIVTSLYNAPMTINLYYSNIVKHDLANSF